MPEVEMKAKYPRLSAATLHRLVGDKAITLPDYDHARRQTSIIHLGAGAFHRCHQAEYADDLLRLGEGEWGIHAINLRPPHLQSMFGVQNGFYAQELRDNGNVNRRIIGAIAKTHDVLGADYDPYRLTLKTALEICTQPTITAITLTITEKGYCHKPATGDIDWDNTDIRHDLAYPAAPKSVPAFLLAVLRRRFALGLVLPTIVCCDNVPNNGATMRNSVTRLGERLYPHEIASLLENGHFLNSMVDRIVPATRDADIERFAAETGLYDYGLVVGEPFRMWVIENPHQAPLPPWDKVGALIVDDVVPFETLKMRVVNGIQSMLCPLGCLAGLEFMSDVMQEPLFARFARQTIYTEVAVNLPVVQGIDNEDYIELTLRRLSNPDLKHRTAQIATDSSQKIKQRLLEPLRRAIARGQPHDGLALGIAGWIFYSGGKSWDGKSHAVNDPLAVPLTRIHRDCGNDTTRLVEAILGLEQIFGTDLSANSALKARLAHFTSALKTQPVYRVLQDFLKIHEEQICQ